MKRLIPLLLCAVLLLSMSVYADDTAAPAGEDAVTDESAGAADGAGAPPAGIEAQNITAQCTIYCNGGLIDTRMTDGSFIDSRGRLPAGSVVKIVSATPIGGIYIRFDQVGNSYWPQDWSYPSEWTLEVGGETRQCGANGFLQQYQGGFNATELTMTFPAETGISDLFVLSPGDVLPEFVNVWEEKPERVDLLLLCCHSDDDQYTFTGLIPWTLDQGMSVQCAYFINHFTHPNRVHELLDGLYACGLRVYPELGRFRDEEHETTIDSYINTGYTRDDLVGTVVEFIRRYQPQVVVGHDFNGEYGHGGHIVYAKISSEAVELSGDESAFPETAAEYGAWEVPKYYVHCWKENPVELNFDVPLSDAFGGRTAYKVGQDAFMKEITQTWYPGQMSYMYDQELATEVRDFRPIDYGLYVTNVGPDVNTDTLFDNITSYAEQERMAEEAARIAAEEEAARIAAEEEAARQAEEAARAEQARLAAEEAARLEREEAARTAEAEHAAEAAAAEARHEKTMGLIRTLLVILAALALVLLLITLLRRSARRRQYRRVMEYTDEPEDPWAGYEEPEGEYGGEYDYYDDYEPEPLDGEAPVYDDYADEYADPEPPSRRGGYGRKGSGGHAR